jgi:hypothetical protein
MNTLTCAYCGDECPEGAPPHGSQILTDHIKICQKHPMREAETKIKKLRAALVGLLGAETKQDLELMEASLRLIPGIGQDKISGINAIHALLETA